MALPILFGILVMVAVICIALAFAPGRSRVLKRLPSIAEQAKPELMRAQTTEAAFLPTDAVRGVEEKLGLGKETTRMKELRKTVMRAGFDSDRAVNIVMGFKLGLPIALPLLAVFFFPILKMKLIYILVILYVVFVIGYFLPDLILGHLVSSRQHKLQEGLPDALDLMVVCVEAGQGMNAAMKKVADEMMIVNKTLAKELNMVNLEINAGIGREQALRNLGERTGVEDMISLCNVLIQADRFGTSIAQTLKVHSEIMRTTRRQRLEELAAKTPVKLVFPLVLLIFPAIMVVILGPAAIRIYEGFIKK